VTSAIEQLPWPAGFREYASAEQLASELAVAVASEICAAVSARGVCHLLVPGGSSPQAFFLHLAGLDLPWHRLHLYPSDERCVPVGDRERNDRMIDEVLLLRANMPFENLHRIPAELGPEAGARCYEQTLQSIPAFDVAVLGVGSDGHIASLFPGHPALYDCRDAVPVTGAPKPPPSRVTVGLRRLRAAGSRHVIALGAEKQAAFSPANRLVTSPVLQFDGNIWCAWV
jgi:6-phosphogluconolactonase